MDNELRLTLQAEILAGDIVINENAQSYFDLLETNFPVGFSGIDWGQHAPVLYLDLRDPSPEDRAERIKGFWLQMQGFSTEILSEKVAVFGDGQTDHAYEMTFEKFCDVWPSFLDIPQHTYIYFRDTKHCLNFTFEEEMIFG
jgi:hypothetical protein